ncbi:unnamed protein product, partial [marine sediment metagenome]
MFIILSIFQLKSVKDSSKKKLELVISGFSSLQGPEIEPTLLFDLKMLIAACKEFFPR